MQSNVVDRNIVRGKEVLGNYISKEDVDQLYDLFNNVWKTTTYSIMVSEQMYELSKVFANIFKGHTKLVYSGKDFQIKADEFARWLQGTKNNIEIYLYDLTYDDKYNYVDIEDYKKKLLKELRGYGITENRLIIKEKVYCATKNYVVQSVKTVGIRELLTFRRDVENLIAVLGVHPCLHKELVRLYDAEKLIYRRNEERVYYKNTGKTIEVMRVIRKRWLSEIKGDVILGELSRKDLDAACTSIYFQLKAEGISKDSIEILQNKEYETLQARYLYLKNIITIVSTAEFMLNDYNCDIIETYKHIYDEYSKSFADSQGAFQLIKVLVTNEQLRTKLREVITNQAEDLDIVVELQNPGYLTKYINSDAVNNKFELVKYKKDSPYDLYSKYLAMRRAENTLIKSYIESIKKTNVYKDLANKLNADWYIVNKPILTVQEYLRDMGKRGVSANESMMELYALVDDGKADIESSLTETDSQNAAIVCNSDILSIVIRRHDIFLNAFSLIERRYDFKREACKKAIIDYVKYILTDNYGHFYKPYGKLQDYDAFKLRFIGLDALEDSRDSSKLSIFTIYENGEWFSEWVDEVSDKDMPINGSKSEDHLIKKEDKLRKNWYELVAREFIDQRIGIK